MLKTPNNNMGLMHHRSISLNRLLIGVSLLAAVAGCGQRNANYESIGLVEVTGRVTLDGKPLEGAYVVFESSDKRQAFGVTDADGQYRLNYNSEQSGVMPDRMKVRILNSPPGEVDAANEPIENTPQSPRVPSQYNTQTTFEVTVEPRGDQRFDFDL